MQKHYRWLHAELQKWVSEGLIDEPLARTLTQRYALTQRAWGKLIFSSIGAVLVGLGVILFFAYNWDELPKLAKLSLVFAALIGSHGAALWIARSDDAEHHTGLVESLHILGTMLFGAGIWLVAQIYHIEEHYPNAILVWGMGALALAWVLPSLSQGFLAVMLVALWAGFESIDFNSVNHWAPIIVMCAILPLAWSERSRVLLFMGLAGLLVVTLLTVAPLESELITTVLFFTGSGYISLGLLSVSTRFAPSHGVFRFIGFSVYLGMLYFLSFAAAVDEIFAQPRLSTLAASVYFFAPLLLACLAWGATFTALCTKLEELWVYQRNLVGAATGLAAIVSLTSWLQPWYVAIAFNLLFLAHCVVFIVQGCRQSNAKLVALACSLFALLVMTRYVDLFESLLLRATVFVLLGAGLFFVGNFYSRSKQADEVAQS